MGKWPSKGYGNQIFVLLLRDGVIEDGEGWQRES